MWMIILKNCTFSQHFRLLGRESTFLQRRKQCSCACIEPRGIFGAIVNLHNFFFSKPDPTLIDLYKGKDPDSSKSHHTDYICSSSQLLVTYLFLFVHITALSTHKLHRFSHNPTLTPATPTQAPPSQGRKSSTQGKLLFFNAQKCYQQLRSIFESQHRIPIFTS